MFGVTYFIFFIVEVKVKVGVLMFSFAYWCLDLTSKFNIELIVLSVTLRLDLRFEVEFES